MRSEVAGRTALAVIGRSPGNGARSA
jgi:hypothetical protein